MYQTHLPGKNKMAAGSGSGYETNENTFTPSEHYHEEVTQAHVELNHETAVKCTFIS